MPRSVQPDKSKRRRDRRLLLKFLHVGFDNGIQLALVKKRVCSDFIGTRHGSCLAHEGNLLEVFLCLWPDLFFALVAQCELTGLRRKYVGYVKMSAVPHSCILLLQVCSHGLEVRGTLAIDKPARLLEVMCRCSRIRATPLKCVCKTLQDHEIQ